MNPITSKQLASMPSYESIGLGPIVKVLLTLDEREYLVSCLREHEDRAERQVVVVRWEGGNAYIGNRWVGSIVPSCEGWDCFNHLEDGRRPFCHRDTLSAAQAAVEKEVRP